MQAPRVLSLPEPCLVVLIGAAGSGKSTLAARLFPPDAVLSSDAYRAVVSGDEADQRATRTAFAILHRELDRRLALGRTTVIDATSVTPFARRGLVRSAAARGVPAVAIVLDLDPQIVLARNAARPGRVVPADAVRRQLADLGRSLRLGVLDAEGFAAVHLVRTPAELDSLAVTRPA
ncbi:MAG: AAA family ATPase [Chloroflexi bacterium]|nr:AAA family ATPase [Chloroflexota bacterium]